MGTGIMGSSEEVASEVTAFAAKLRLVEWKWTDAAFGEAQLAACEDALRTLRPGCATFGEYLNSVSGAAEGHSWGPCTAVWTAGAAAYRCRQCALTPSSAVCPECFCAADHVGHDVQMYISQSGGCCDCGDPNSWRINGCCPSHRPASEATPSQALSAMEEAVMKGVTRAAVLHLAAAVLGSVRGSPVGARYGNSAQLLRWLEPLARVKPLRELLCAAMVQTAVQYVSQPGESCHAGDGGGGAPPAAVPESSSESGATSSPSPTDARTEPHPVAAPAPADSLPLGRQCGAAQEDLAALLRFAPRMNPPALGGRTPLQLILDALPVAAPQLCEGMTTLLILLLYDDPFKLHFGEAMFAEGGLYGEHVRHRRNLQTATALDRLLIQLNTNVDIALELEQRMHVCFVVARCHTWLLENVTLPALDSDRPLPVDATRFDLLYSRPILDLHQMLTHPQVGPALFPSPSAFQEMLHLLDDLQGACPHKRATTHHVLYEDPQWLFIMDLEAQTTWLGMGTLAATVLSGAQQGQLSQAQAIAVLLEALRRSLHAAWSRTDPPSPSGHELWSGLMDGRETVCFNLPLQRVASLFLQHLVHLTGGSIDPAALRTALLGGPGAFQALAARLGTSLVPLNQGREWEDGTGPPREVWCTMAHLALKVCVWTSQVRAGLWVRNGETLAALPGLYHGDCNGAYPKDRDLLTLQVWAATQEHPAAVVAEVMGAFGGAQLWAGAMGSGGAPGVLDVGPAQLQCIGDGVALLVALVREGGVWDPPSSEVSVRRAVVHALAAAAPCTRSQLEPALPDRGRSPHTEQVLAEAADYTPPSEEEPARYNLKREAWRAEFDPHYSMYSPAKAAGAVERAQAAGAWRPEQQLELPARPLPAALGNVWHLVSLAETARLAVLILRAALLQPAGWADTTALAAVNLLALSVHAAQAEHLAGTQQQQQRLREVLVALCSGPAADGMPSALTLLGIAAGTEAGEGGQRRESSWQLAACAAHLTSMLRTFATPPSSPGGPAPDLGAADAAAGTERKREAVRRRRQRALEHIRGQQARFAAGQAGEEPSSPMAVEVSFVVEEGGGGAAEVSFPLHHPLAWTKSGGECAMCRAGSEVGPLSWMTQLHVSNLPALAAALPPSPPPQHWYGPRLSAFDLCPGTHALCCGHMLHHSCVGGMRQHTLQQAVGGVDYPGVLFLRDPLDLGSNVEMLCPICRRLFNAVLPVTAVAPDAGGGSAIPGVGTCVHVPAEGWVCAVQAPQPQLRPVTPPHPLLPSAQGLDAWVASSQPDEDLHKIAHQASVCATNEAMTWLEGAAAHLSRLDTHLARLDAGDNWASALWEMLGHNVAHWEAVHRGGASSPVAPTVDAAHWRALQALAHASLSAPQVAPLSTPSHVHVDALLPWLLGLEQGPLPPDTTVVVVDVLRSLLPVALCADGPPGSGPPQPPSSPALGPLDWLQGVKVVDPVPATAFTDLRSLVGDPFALLLELVAGLTTPLGGGPVGQRAVMAQPVVALRAVLPALWTISVAQAAALAAYAVVLPGQGSSQLAAMAAREAQNSGSGEQEREPPAPAVGLAALLEVAEGLEGGAVVEAALCALLSPILQRVCILLALCSGQPPPPPAPADPAAVVAQALQALPELQGVLPTLRCISLLPRPLTMLRRCVDTRRELRVEPPACELVELALANGGRLTVHLHPAAAPPQLARLPAQFQEWFLQLRRTVCSCCGQVPVKAAVCLHCGALMCCSNGTCTGPTNWAFCSTHAQVCGAGTAMFLLPQTTQVLALRGVRASLLPSPYLDEHGEEDKGMRRGRPLYLSSVRYAQLAQLWRGGALDFDSTALHAAQHVLLEVD